MVAQVQNTAKQESSQLREHGQAAPGGSVESSHIGHHQLPFDCVQTQQRLESNASAHTDAIPGGMGRVHSSTRSTLLLFSPSVAQFATVQVYSQTPPRMANSCSLDSHLLSPFGTFDLQCFPCSDRFVFNVCKYFSSILVIPSRPCFDALSQSGQLRVVDVRYPVDTQ